MAACASSHDKEDHILACVNMLLEKDATGDSFDRSLLFLPSSPVSCVNFCFKMVHFILL